MNIPQNVFSNLLIFDDKIGRGKKCYLRQPLPVVVGLVFGDSVHCGCGVGGDRLVGRVEEVLQVGGGALCFDDVD